MLPNRQIVCRDFSALARGACLRYAGFLSRRPAMHGAGRMPCDLFYANITNASTICSGRSACLRHVICSLGDQLGKEWGACFQIAVIFLYQRDAHVSDMLLSFLGD